MKADEALAFASALIDTTDLDPDSADVRPGMRDDEILAILDQEISQARDTQWGRIAEDRAKSLDYYLGEPFGNEVAGRSQYISSDVSDIIDGILPALLKIFTASDDAVEFQPQSEEDVEGAEQATDAANYVFYRQNNGFLILHDWFKDALLQKNGIVKYWWDDRKDTKYESYQGLNEDQLQMLVQTPDTEVTAYTLRPDGLADVSVTISDDQSRIVIEGVPPEEFLVSREARSLDLNKARFVGHRVRFTRSDLREMGFADVDDLFDEDSDDYGMQTRARDGENISISDGDNTDEAMETVWGTECYILIDSGNGIAERRKMLKCGNRLLSNEQFDHVPFASLTPIPMPHRFNGRSVADLVMEIQRMKSAWIRQINDNLYLSNNPRHTVIEGQANLDDLLTSRPGGIVRIKSPGAVTALVTPFVAGGAMDMVEYLDTRLENRTGVTRYNQGLDANSLNKTATGITQIMNASQQRIELIARIFAETGVKALFKGILHLLTKYQSQPMIARLRNKFVALDPRGWNNQMDMTINVGLGTGNKDQQLIHLQTVMQIQREMLMGGLNTIVTPENLYKTASKIVENAGWKSADDFFTDPVPKGEDGEPLPPGPEQPDPAAQAAEAAMQAEQQKMQAQLEADQQKVQVANEIEQQRMGQDMEKAAATTKLGIEKLRQEKELEIYRLQQEEKLKVYEIDKHCTNAMQLKQMDAASKAGEQVDENGKRQPSAETQALLDMVTQLSQAVQLMAATAAAPKMIVRGPDGRAEGIKPIGV